MGHTDGVKVKLGDMGRQAYALLPYQVQGITLSVTPDKKAQTGDVLRLVASVKTSGKAGAHLVRFEALDPDGQPVLCFRDKVWTSPQGGQAPQATTQWPLAFNERPGKWTVRATDVLSGARAEQTIRVQARR